MTETKFFKCRQCGNIVGLIVDGAMPLSCCGENMQRLEANTVDASLEKHVPVITVEKDRAIVEVGSLPHPMTLQHYIPWIYLQTNFGGKRKSLYPAQLCRAVFALLPEERVIAAYAYCNLHGLWRGEYAALEEQNAHMLPKLEELGKSA